MYKHEVNLSLYSEYLDDKKNDGEEEYKWAIEQTKHILMCRANDQDALYVEHKTKGGFK